MKSSVKLDFKNSPRTIEYRWAALHSGEAGWWEGKGTADRPQDHRSPNRQETSPPKRGALPAQEPCNLGQGNAGKPSASSQHLGKKDRKHSQGASGAPEGWPVLPGPQSHPANTPLRRQSSCRRHALGAALTWSRNQSPKGKRVSHPEQVPSSIKRPGSQQPWRPA